MVAERVEGNRILANLSALLLLLLLLSDEEPEISMRLSRGRAARKLRSPSAQDFETIAGTPGRRGHPHARFRSRRRRVRQRAERARPVHPVAPRRWRRADGAAQMVLHRWRCTDGAAPMALH